MALYPIRMMPVGTNRFSQSCVGGRERTLSYRGDGIAGELLHEPALGLRAARGQDRAHVAGLAERPHGIAPLRVGISLWPTSVVDLQAPRRWDECDWVLPPQSQVAWIHHG